jgi:hypothetical protein
MVGFRINLISEKKFSIFTLPHKRMIQCQLNSDWQYVPDPNLHNGGRGKIWVMQRGNIRQRPTICDLPTF